MRIVLVTRLFEQKLGKKKNRGQLRDWKHTNKFSLLLRHCLHGPAPPPRLPSSPLSLCLLLLSTPHTLCSPLDINQNLSLQLFLLPLCQNSQELHQTGKLFHCYIEPSLCPVCVCVCVCVCVWWAHVVELIECAHSSSPTSVTWRLAHTRTLDNLHPPPISTIAHTNTHTHARTHEYTH